MNNYNYESLPNRVFTNVFTLKSLNSRRQHKLIHFNNSILVHNLQKYLISLGIKNCKRKFPGKVFNVNNCTLTIIQLLLSLKSKSTYLFILNLYQLPFVFR